MIKLLLLAFVFLVGGLLAVIATRPANFRVSRSATIAAPPAAVFAHVNDFRRWEAWSPWAKMDPNSRAEFAGPESGVGAEFSWAGNNQVGEGRQRIVESRPPELVRIRIDFIKPFTASNDVELTFVPEGDGTRVTWTMSGVNNFMGKAVSLVMDCDKMVGPQFEQGLANLKSVAERGTTL